MAKPIEHPFFKNQFFDNNVKSVKNNGFPCLRWFVRRAQNPAPRSWRRKAILSSSKTLHWSTK
jgi:hypothetical protein